MPKKFGKSFVIVGGRFVKSRMLSFDAEWHDLLGILESIEHSTDVKTLKSAKKWLQSLYERKHSGFQGGYGTI